MALLRCSSPLAAFRNSPPSVVVAAGDTATCSGTDDEATAKLVGGIEGTVLTLGDDVYPDGSAQDFEECYEPTWGQFKGRTKPTPGNHEYHTEGAEGYFDYFGKAAGNPDESYGVLKLTLHPHSYEWQFVPVERETFSDSGDTRCH